MKTITNLEELEVLNVNIYEVEDALFCGETKYKTYDNTFLIIELDCMESYKYETLSNEVILNTNEDVSYLIKKI